MSRDVRILNITPHHPGRGEPSRVEALIDLGHKSGKAAVVVIPTAEAFELAGQFLNAALIVQRVNSRRVPESEER